MEVELEKVKYGSTTKYCAIGHEPDTIFTLERDGFVMRDGANTFVVLAPDAPRVIAWKMSVNAACLAKGRSLMTLKSLLRPREGRRNG
jgi:hypothetical protein